MITVLCHRSLAVIASIAASIAIAIVAITFG
jgi:hypothetical protein